MHFLLQTGQLLIVDSWSWSHEDSRGSCCQFLPVLIIIDLDILGLDELFGLRLHLNCLFLFAEGAALKSELLAVDVVELLIDHGSILDFVMISKQFG